MATTSQTRGRPKGSTGPTTIKGKINKTLRDNLSAMSKYNTALITQLKRLEELSEHESMRAEDFANIVKAMTDGYNALANNTYKVAQCLKILGDNPDDEDGPKSVDAEEVMGELLG